MTNPGAHADAELPEFLGGAVDVDAPVPHTR